MPHSISTDDNASRNQVPFWTADNLVNTEQIPTYLFRLTAPSTDGTTTESYVCPPKPLNENFLDLERCDAVERLLQHMEPVYGHETDCNFMSWSSSLLFLIQYAFYRYTKWWEDRDFNNIKIFVIDTRNMPKGVFAKDIDLLSVLNTACDCKSHKDLKYFNRMRNGKYYFGEYLTQGDKRNWSKWANPVMWSRTHLYYRNNAPPASKEEVYAAIAIAKTLFDGPWSLHVAAMLLGFKPRQRNDPVILKFFMEEYGDLFQQEDIIRDIRSQELIIDSKRLPEVEQYQNIIDDISSVVLGNDEPGFSDTDNSTDNDSTSVDDLATAYEMLSM
ncbi:hypothetical protein TMatcc_002124 [Talaromyces marneffei ATCC 18224]